MKEKIDIKEGMREWREYAKRMLDKQGGNGGVASDSDATYGGNAARAEIRSNTVPTHPRGN